MSAQGVWAGLSGSAFLADVTDRDRRPARLGATLVGGLFVGLAAATACWILILVPYTFIAGLGGEGLRGLGKVAERFEDPGARGLGITLLRLLESTATDGVFPVAFVALAALVANHPFLRYVTAATGVRWRLLAVGVCLSAIAMSPLVLADRLSAPGGASIPMLDVAPDWLGRLGYGVSALLLIPAAAAEELLFRGWLMRQVAAFTRQPVVLVMLTAVLFAAAHFDFTPDAFLTRAIMGAGFAYMTLRLGGIEFSTGVHAANNILIVMFIEPLSLPSAPPPSGVSPGAWLGELLMLTGYVLITEAVVRIGPLRRWAGVRPEDIAPPLIEAARFS